MGTIDISEFYIERGFTILLNAKYIVFICGFLFVNDVDIVFTLV